MSNLRKVTMQTEELFERWSRTKLMSDVKSLITWAAPGTLLGDAVDLCFYGATPNDNVSKFIKNSCLTYSTVFEQLYPLHER